MSRSSSSSGSNTPSPQGSPKLLSSFDPFAVHPFTNYSGPSQHARGAAPSNQIHVLPHPSTLSLDAPAPGIPYPAGSSHHHSHYCTSNSNDIVHHPTPIPAGYHSQASQTHSGPSSSSSSARPIFVPFRQETSSPDLSDVLRRKRMGL